MARSYTDKDSVMAPFQIGFDVVVHATDPLDHTTRSIMVSDDDATITGYLEGNSDTPHTTLPLKAGVYHPFAFTRITAISAGTAKGYC